MLRTENEQQRRADTLAAMMEALTQTAPVLSTLHNGSPGSEGDAGMDGMLDSDGTYTPFFRCGMKCGSAPLRPDY